jgi:NADH-quinone oxidoreductase subunit J
MIVQNLIFNIFAAIAIVCSTMTIASKNPVHSVLFLILVFCNSAALLLMLGAEFLAMLFIVVYVGAIAVLFLFVVMMLNIKLAEFSDSFTKYLPLGLAIIAILLFETFIIVDSNFYSHDNYVNNLTLDYTSWFQLLNTKTNMEVIGVLLYTNYFYLFIVASLILLVSMIGAIALTLHKKSDAKRQQIFLQVYRDFNRTIKLVK